MLKVHVTGLQWLIFICTGIVLWTLVRMSCSVKTLLLEFILVSFTADYLHMCCI